MLPKLAHISAPAPSADRRGAARRVISFGFDTSDFERNSRILILDLSQSGLLLQTSAELEVGEKIRIEIPEAGTVEARIVRRNGDRFGAMFDSPIGKAAVSAVLLAAPAEPPPLEEAEIDAAQRSYRAFNPAPDWLVMATLVVTGLATALFIYALAFLPVTG